MDKQMENKTNIPFRVTIYLHGCTVSTISLAEDEFSEPTILSYLLSSSDEWCALRDELGQINYIKLSNILKIRVEEIKV